jgi:flavin reductase (DIM6/NTAB) family NADH-FMN oxidoreductase RutF
VTAPPVEAILDELWAPPVAVTAAHGGRANGLIASTAVAASLPPDPPRLVVQLAKLSLTHELALASGAFAVHLLPAEPLERSLELFRVLGTRTGHEGEKLGGFAWEPGVTGSPILADALAYVEARVVATLDAGGSTIVLADVVAAVVVVAARVVVAALVVVFAAGALAAGPATTSSTRSPFATRVPGAGDCARMVPRCRFEGDRWTSAFNPFRSRLRVAGPSEAPTSAGTLSGARVATRRGGLAALAGGPVSRVSTHRTASPARMTSARTRPAASRARCERASASTGAGPPFGGSSSSGGAYRGSTGQSSSGAVSASVILGRAGSPMQPV